MPFVHTYVHQNTSPERRTAIVGAIHDALVTGIGMPQDELFNLVHPYDPAQFHYSRSFNGIARSDQLIVIEITLRRGRSDAMKRALYAAIAENLIKLGLSARDLFIFMHENDYSDWSVGNGQFAMNIVQQRGDDA
jgi:phenylpyruvate tautomerase PptA (4-oxalocrotonate tautomerase family)